MLFVEFHLMTLDTSWEMKHVIIVPGLPNRPPGLFTVIIIDDFIFDKES